jgi:hypothetical protein
VLTRARRSAAALALEPHPGSKGQIMTHAQIAELDKHNREIQRRCNHPTTFTGVVRLAAAER